MRAKNATFLLLTIAAVLAYGCSSTESAEEDEPVAEAAENELILRRGSVDHAAIVEATTIMLAGKPTDGILDPYNQEDPFAIRSDRYEETFAERLGSFDALDGTTDWKPDQAKAWAGRMAAGNYLVIDTSKPCNFEDPHTYLEIERSHMLGRDHTTCGGRMPNEDALDVTLDFLVRGPAGLATDDGSLQDGVDQATKKSGAEFPFLADSNGI